MQKAIEFFIDMSMLVVSIHFFCLWLYTKKKIEGTVVCTFLYSLNTAE